MTLVLSQREAIRDARRKGMSLPDIQQTLLETGLRVGKETIRKVVEDVPSPFPKRTGRRGASPELKAQILILARTGFSIKEIMVATGASSKLIIKTYQRAGIRRRRGRRPSTATAPARAQA